MALVWYGIRLIIRLGRRNGCGGRQRKCGFSIIWVIWVGITLRWEWWRRTGGFRDTSSRKRFGAWERKRGESAFEIGQFVGRRIGKGGCLASLNRLKWRGRTTGLRRIYTQEGAIWRISNNPGRWERSAYWLQTDQYEEEGPISPWIRHEKRRLILAAAAEEPM